MSETSAPGSPIPASHPRQGQALVVYESMFGNTAAIARCVADGLAHGGVAVETRHVATAFGHDLGTYDLLVVGGPTHAFSLSRATTRHDAVRQGAPAEVESPGVREWLESLPPSILDGPRLAAAFDTRVTRVRYLPKAASGRAARMLAHHGFTVMSRPTGFVVEDVQGDLLPGERERAVQWGRDLAVRARDRLAAAAAR